MVVSDRASLSDAPSAIETILAHHARRRCLIVNGGVASSSQLYDFEHARRRVYGERLDQLTRWGVLRVAQGVADRVGRAGTRGRPWLWRLRTD
jgi:hypothetical protein